MAVVVLAWISALLMLLGLMSRHSNLTPHIFHKYLRVLSDENEKPPIVQASGKSIYILTDGVLHHIPDWDTFVNLGYSIHDIKYISDDEMRSYTIGNPVAAIVEPTYEFSPYPYCPCYSKSRYNVTKKIYEDSPRNERFDICFLNNTYSKILFSRSELNHQFKMNYKVVPDTNKTNTENCDVVINLVNTSITQQYLCPGVCLPKPFIDIPLALIDTNYHSNLNASLTCSLSVSDVFTPGSALYMHYSKQKGTDSFERSSKGILLREIARRKIQECVESEGWGSGLSKEDNNTELHVYHRTARRKVYGLIIWVGSLSRYGLLKNQVSVLTEQSKAAGDDDSKRIFGWMAAEDVYSCRVGTTICTDLTRNWAYFNYMPTTQMNVVSSGWSCAQRRQLRSLQHSLLLFDPEFVLMVDDDTFVNIEKIKYGSPLSSYILDTLKTYPAVFGQLTMGKKITKHGFYYGGAGYLLGRASLQRLTGKELMGPVNNVDEFRDEMQMTYLALLRQVKDANLTCPVKHPCVKVISNPEGAYTGYHDVAKIDVRLIEMCTNVMSEEHTCYHSDHALSRCFVHAAYLIPANIQCGSNIGPTPAGMCMGGPCDLNYQLTCHRYMADPDDAKKGVPAVYNITVDKIKLNGE